MRNRLSSFFFILALILSALLPGCQAIPAAAPETQAPGSEIPGYYALSQGLAGGGSEGGSLRSLAVSRKQEEYLLELSFAEGQGVPTYAVDGLSSPARLRVTLPGVRPDFAGQDFEPIGIFQGVFYESSGEKLEIYFQFLGGVAYKIKTQGDKLTLLARADAMEQEGGDYALQLPYTGESAPFAREMGMAPALCDDLLSLSYLTAGFRSLEEADAARLQLEEELSAADADATSSVVFIAAGQNPPFTPVASRKALKLLGAMKTQDGVKEARIFALDARFLCWADDRTAVMACPGTDEEGEPYEELWLYSRDGSRKLLFEGRFSSLQKAALSPKGDTLALIEQLNGMRLSYVYNIENKGLELLSGKGFGDYTADFAWNENGKLYAMTGDDVVQLMVYDPGLEGGEQSPVSALEERQGSYGSVLCAGPFVYFADETDDILRVSVETAERELFAAGSDALLLSPDGAFAALVGYEEGGEDARLSHLTLRRFAGGEEEDVEVSSGRPLGAFCFSLSGQTLYYLTGDGETPEYPVALHAFDVLSGEGKELGRLSSNSVFASPDESALILMAYYERGGEYRPVSYWLDLAGE
ncbi:MAG: hypothetical protein LBU47_04105 [Christensenellaceae bacterium]|jgi:hypothetical protein|nr:hypothetical protein [Christensenellaceae bacterium]